MKQILIILLVVFSYNAYSQSAFELLIQTEEDEKVYDALELANGNVVMVGGRSYFIGENSLYSTFESGYLVKINSDGEIISEKEITLQDSCFIIKTISLNNNNELIVIGTAMRKDIGYANVFVYQEYDLDFNLLKDKRYKTPINKVDISIYKTKKMNNGNSIICGTIFQESDLDMFYFEINEQGDSLNSNFYISEEKNYNLSFDIIQKPDNSGYYSLVFGYPDPSNSTPGQILNMDNDLNVISYNETSEDIHGNGSLKWLTDTTFIYTGTMTLNENSELVFNLGISISDTTNTILYTNSFGEDTIRSICGAYNSLEYNKGDNFIYTSATYDYRFETGGSFSYIPTHIQFVKTNLELDPVWEKFYKGDACYIVQFFKRTNDGGFLFLSSRYDSETQDHERDIHILKVDADGNMPTNIENTDIEVTELIIYPNPGTNLLQIRTAVQQLGGLFYIYDITGKQVMQQYINTSISQINTSNLASGTYIYKYINNNKLIETGKWVKQ